MVKFSLALLAFSIVSVLFISSAHTDKEMQMTDEIYSACKEKGVYVFADSSIIKCEVK
jgi:hypothetical protein